MFAAELVVGWKSNSNLVTEFIELEVENGDNLFDELYDSLPS